VSPTRTTTRVIAAAAVAGLIPLSAASAHHTKPHTTVSLKKVGSFTLVQGGANSPDAASSDGTVMLDESGAYYQHHLVQPSNLSDYQYAFWNEIDDHDLSIGSITPAGGESEAAAWQVGANRPAKALKLGSLALDHSGAAVVDDRGEIAGVSSDSSGAQIGWYMKSPTSTAVEVKSPHGSHPAFILAMNPRWEVIGEQISSTYRFYRLNRKTHKYADLTKRFGPGTWGVPAEGLASDGTVLAIPEVPTKKPSTTAGAKAAGAFEITASGKRISVPVAKALGANGVADGVNFSGEVGVTDVGIGWLYAASGKATNITKATNTQLPVVLLSLSGEFVGLDYTASGDTTTYHVLNLKTTKNK
jgi:hypothetical protein